MKCFTFSAQLFSCSILFAAASFSQPLVVTEAEAPHSKNIAKKGLYGGTYLINGGGARAFYIFPNKKKGLGFDAYDFGQDGKFKSVDAEIQDVDALAKKFNLQPPPVSPNEKFSTNKEIMIVRTNLLGVLVVDKGYISADYDTDFSPPFFTGYSFTSTDKKKPDIKVLPAGFIPLGDVMDASVTGGLKKVISGTDQETVLMGNSSVMVAGIIKEKIVISKNPPPYNNNRFACLEVSGEELEVKKEEIYEMPFAMVPVTTGKIGQDVMFLYSTLQAPTTVESTNVFNMKDERKKSMMFLRVNKNADLVDSVHFLSNSVRGTFGLFADGEDVFIPGWINEGHSGYYRWDVGKASHFQLIKISGGKVEYMKQTAVEDLESNLVVPEGEKAKFSLTTNSAEGVLKFNEMKKLANGDFLVVGQTISEYFAIQVGPDGEFKKYYSIEEIDKEFGNYAFRTNEFKGKIYFSILEVPADVAQGVHYNSSKYSTSVLRIDDFFSKARVVRMDPESKTMSQQVDIGGKKYYAIGEDPLLFDETSGNLYLTGTDRKKTLYMNTLK